MIINLNTITDKNAHAAIVLSGHKKYHFIGPNRPDRNLVGSPLHRPFLAPEGAKKGPGPSNLLQYRQWLWSQIRRHASVARQNTAILSALRQVAVCKVVVHEDKAEIAALIERAAKWYKEKVFQPAIVCTKCLTYLTDHNKGDFHICAECAWSGRDFDTDHFDSLSFFCSDCGDVLHIWLSQMYGQCKPCRDFETQEMRAMHPHL